MSRLAWSATERAFVVWAFAYLIVLIVHFAVRERWFEAYTEPYGWIVYALGVPAVGLSLWFLAAGEDWTLWAAGFVCLAFSAFGTWVDYGARIAFRSPFVASVGVPYVLLYLATLMAYWWPLWDRDRRLWGAYAVLYVVAMVLNVRSH